MKDIKPKKKKLYTCFSKKLVQDTRMLLWAITLGGLLLAFYCVRVAYTGALPWISGMVSAAWAAHGTICSFYINMAKSDHKDGGITMETAKANNFKIDSVDNVTGNSQI